MQTFNIGNIGANATCSYIIIFTKEGGINYV